MSNINELRRILNKRLLLAAQGQGDVEEVLTGDDSRDPDDTESFLYDINCRDVLENTPLHLAVTHGSVEDVRLLIEADGCDVDLQNSNGDTPLHLAVKIPDSADDNDLSVRRAIVRALVEDAGALDSTRITNNAGQTPRDLCHIYCPGDTEVLKLASPPPHLKTVGMDIGHFG